MSQIRPFYRSGINPRFHIVYALTPPERSIRSIEVFGTRSFPADTLVRSKWGDKTANQIAFFSAIYTHAHGVSILAHVRSILE